MVPTKEIRVVLVFLGFLTQCASLSTLGPLNMSSTKPLSLFPPIIMDGQQPFYISDEAKNSTIKVPTEKSINYKSCPGQAGAASQMAINDAVTMAKLLLQNNNWMKPEYRGPLEKYMGTNCFGQTTKFQEDEMRPVQGMEVNKWINMVLTNIAGVQWSWYDYILSPFYSAFYKIYVYCDGSYPSWNDNFKPSCQWNTFGWSHGGPAFPTNILYWSYAIGFCSEHLYRTFVPLASMEKFANTGAVDRTKEERLGANYGRAGIHQLVELWGPISPAHVYADSVGSDAVAQKAAQTGCGLGGSLVQADHWAHWINAAYFQIKLNMGANFPQPGPLNLQPGDVTESSNCDGSSYCKYMDVGECVKAINKIDDNAVYSRYMTRTSKSKGHLKGCMVRFDCQEGLCPPNGVNGTIIKQRLRMIQSDQYCGKNGQLGMCGSIYFSDYTALTLNMCSSCTDDG